METPRWALPAITAGCGLLVGGAVGYLIGKKNGTTVINETFTFSDAKKKSLDFDTVSEIISDVVDESKEPENPVVIEKVVIDEEAFEAQIKAQEQLNEYMEPRTKPNNIFVTDTDEEWDYEKELKERTPTAPYVIHKDEFMSNESDYTQETITFYAGDEIMADQHDEILHGWMNMMGPLTFGHGSGDPNVVYIRNDTLHYEWEVLRHGGRFEVEVGGLTVEDEYEKQDLKHSNSPRKFREF